MEKQHGGVAGGCDRSVSYGYRYRCYRSVDKMAGFFYTQQKLKITLEVEVDYLWNGFEPQRWHCFRKGL